MHKTINSADLKKMILDDVINWRYKDPYDFKDLFIKDKENKKYDLFPKEKEHIEHGYPICDEPYEKCPICGGELDDSVLETECAEDIFNSSGGYDYYGEYSGSWDEIRRCPHCEKLFCIEAWT